MQAATARLVFSIFVLTAVLQQTTARTRVRSHYRGGSVTSGSIPESPISSSSSSSISSQRGYSDGFLSSFPDYSRRDSSILFGSSSRGDFAGFSRGSSNGLPSFSDYRSDFGSSGSSSRNSYSKGLLPRGTSDGLPSPWYDYRSRDYSPFRSSGRSSISMLDSGSKGIERHSSNVLSYPDYYYSRRSDSNLFGSSSSMSSRVRSNNGFQRGSSNVLLSSSYPDHFRSDYYSNLFGSSSRRSSGGLLFPVSSSSSSSSRVRSNNGYRSRGSSSDGSTSSFPENRSDPSISVNSSRVRSKGLFRSGDSSDGFLPSVPHYRNSSSISGNSNNSSANSSMEIVRDDSSSEVSPSFILDSVRNDSSIFESSTSNSSIVFRDSSGAPSSIYDSNISESSNNSSQGNDNLEIAGGSSDDFKVVEESSTNSPRSSNSTGIISDSSDGLLKCYACEGSGRDDPCMLGEMSDTSVKIVTCEPNEFCHILRTVTVLNVSENGNVTTEWNIKRSCKVYSEKGDDDFHQLNCDGDENIGGTVDLACATDLCNSVDGTLLLVQPKKCQVQQKL